MVVPPQSFTQQARLAITLAWVAGYTNTVALVACGAAVSHVSGTTSRLGIDAAEGRWAAGLFALFLLVSFFLGALASGACSEIARRRGWASAFALPIAVEAALLLLFALGLELSAPESRSGGTTLYTLTGVATMAMGLQNATITRISSGVVRTTHVTGVLTDLGIETAQCLLWLSEKRSVRAMHTHPAARRLALLVSIIGSFALGAGLGAFAYGAIERWAMNPPVLFLIWLIYRDLKSPIARFRTPPRTTPEREAPLG